MAKRKNEPGVEKLEQNIIELDVMLRMIPLIKDQLTPEQKADLKSRLEMLHGKIEAFRVRLEALEAKEAVGCES